MLVHIQKIFNIALFIIQLIIKNYNFLPADDIG